MPGPCFARNLPTGVSAPSGASSSTWFSPTSSSTASTPCSSTTSRCASVNSKLSRYSSSAGSISSTATPMWSMRLNTSRSLYASRLVPAAELRQRDRSGWTGAQRWVVRLRRSHHPQPHARGLLDQVLALLVAQAQRPLRQPHVAFRRAPHAGGAHREVMHHRVRYLRHAL